MGKRIRNYFPPIGMRIVKSAIAVLLCFLVSLLRGDSGIVFYSQLAALWCMQVYVENSKKMASQRTIGTIIGALYGLVVIVARKEISSDTFTESFYQAIFISGMIIIVIYTTVLIHKKQASYFSCVVFLSIVVNHIADQNPYLFVWNRFLDTMIGIAIGVFVNFFKLPRKKSGYTLFVSGLDDTLLNRDDNLSDYSRIELNRMIKDGALFTISTMRTPASLIELLKDIQLNLPVIAMDGAVLYDIKEKVYIHSYVISHQKSAVIADFIRLHNMNCFINVIIDDMLVIYYQESEDEIYNQLISRMRRSPFRNYVKRNLPENEDVVYFMLLDKTNRIEYLYKCMEQVGFTNELKIIKYLSTDYLGYSYIKIYNQNATKKNMMDYLKNKLNVKKVITFGSIKGHYDYVVTSGDCNQVVKTLKKQYEPIILSNVKKWL